MKKLLAIAGALAGLFVLEPGPERNREYAEGGEDAERRQPGGGGEVGEVAAGRPDQDVDEGKQAEAAEQRPDQPAPFVDRSPGHEPERQQPDGDRLQPGDHHRGQGRLDQARHEGGIGAEGVARPAQGEPGGDRHGKGPHRTGGRLATLVLLRRGSQEDHAQHHAPQVARLERGKPRDDHEDPGENQRPGQHPQPAHLTGHAPMLEQPRQLEGDEHHHERHQESKEGGQRGGIEAHVRAQERADQRRQHHGDRDPDHVPRPNMALNALPRRLSQLFRHPTRMRS